jgi:hypothetical protein
MPPFMEKRELRMVGAFCDGCWTGEASRKGIAMIAQE